MATVRNSACFRAHIPRSCVDPKMVVALESVVTSPMTSWNGCHLLIYHVCVTGVVEDTFCLGRRDDVTLIRYSATCVLGSLSRKYMHKAMGEERTSTI